jgi:D-hydroxyproline dehydrogenase subunit alpha
MPSRDKQRRVRAIRTMPKLLVVGSGPAGMAAAAHGSSAGLDVTMVDEGLNVGGQYYRSRPTATGRSSPTRFRVSFPRVRVLGQSVLFDIPYTGAAAVWSEREGAQLIEYDALCIATGAYDRPVALPGWTLPGVLTAGGAHTFSTSLGARPGSRIVVAGAGPFLLPVAAGLAEHGCSVELVDAVGLAGYVKGVSVAFAVPSLLVEAAYYGARMARHGVRGSKARRMVTGIHGDGRVQFVTVQRVDRDWWPIPGSEAEIPADGVCLSFGFVPQLELPALIECEIRYDECAGNFSVVVDDLMRTSAPLVFAAGEATGIAGAKTARVEGSLAGLTAALDLGVISGDHFRRRASRLQRQLRRLGSASEWMRAAFRPRPGLWTLADASTIVCRCEDVTLSQIDQAVVRNSVTPATIKRHTRAGMGLCQGRTCLPFIIEHVRSSHGYEVPSSVWPWSVRPPIRRVPMSAWTQVYPAER